mmetsp:Transcript_47982/g.148060  ORF Transcript_47982/g.148060 Transcript_47982/m.148060 type:complete len:286 (-) Transcript_47982:341-1198(-)
MLLHNPKRFFRNAPARQRHVQRPQVFAVDRKRDEGCRCETGADSRHIDLSQSRAASGDSHNARIGHAGREGNVERLQEWAMTGDSFERGVPHRAPRRAHVEVPQLRTALCDGDHRGVGDPAACLLDVQRCQSHRLFRQGRNPTICNPTRSVRHIQSFKLRAVSCDGTDSTIGDVASAGHIQMSEKRHVGGRGHERVGRNRCAFYVEMTEPLAPPRQGDERVVRQGLQSVNRNFGQRSHPSEDRGRRGRQRCVVKAKQLDGSTRPRRDRDRHLIRNRRTVAVEVQC